MPLYSASKIIIGSVKARGICLTISGVIPSPLATLCLPMVIFFKFLGLISIGNISAPASSKANGVDITGTALSPLYVF